jgi:hypothetical protein
MRSFRFNKLWLLSEKEKKARIVHFQPNSNALVGTNHTGKSTISRNLFAAFGCNTRPFGGEWDEDAIVAVAFNIEGQDYTMLKRGGLFTLLNENNLVQWSTAEAGVLRDNLSKLFGFVLTLVANRANENRPARPAFFFVPFFIDQDGSWDSSWRTFQSLGEFQNWERPTLDLALGIRPPEYWSASSEFAGKKRELDDVVREHKVLEAARNKLAERFPRMPWYRDAMAFRRELKVLETQAGELAVEQDAVRSRAAEASASRDSLIAQIRLLDGALGTHASDMVFLDSYEVGNDIICPTCGTAHEHSFHERLNLEAEADELRQLRTTLSARVKVAEREHNAIAKSLEDLDSLAERIDKLLDTERGKLKLREVIDRAGVDKAFDAFDEQRTQLDNARGELSREIDELESKLALLEDPKLAKTIRAFLNAKYSEFATQLQVPPSLHTRKGEVKIKPQQGGSGGPRAILAYYFALAHTASRYSPALLPPLVIDSPHQKAQDEIKRPMVTEFIFRNRVPGQQLIVGVEEDLPQSIHLNELDSRTELTVEYGLLQDAQFEEAYSDLQPLLAAAAEHLKQVGALTRD